jgi:hypothetical protein
VAAQPEDQDEEKFHQALNELYGLARRQATGTDKVVRDIVEELRRREPPF